MGLFLRVEGSGCSGSALKNNALGDAGKAFELGADVPAGVVIRAIP
jgi:hypothetical protein